MLFDSTVRRELARSFGATLVVILTIVLTMFLIRIVGQAASGAVAPQDVVLLLGYVALGHLPTMLALSLFVAIVVTLGRMYRDSEMAIWFASGVGLSRFVRPVLRTSWPVLLVVALLLLFVWPWGNRSSLELRDRYQQRSDLSRVTPGVFQTSSDGRRVFFVERESSRRRQRAQRLHPDAPGRAASRSPRRAAGRLEADGDDRYLVLERGQRNDVDLKNGERTLSSFESYRVLASEARGALGREPAAAHRAPRSTCMRQPTRAQPGRTRLALRAAAGRGQPAAAGHRPGRHQPAARQQLEPAVRAAGLRRLLQPGQPVAGLGRQRPPVDGRWRCWACTAACSRWRWRCSGGATTPRSRAAAVAPAPAGGGMKTVRRLLYRDIVRFGGVRRAGLPVAVLLHRLRRRARQRRPPRPRRLAGGACRRPGSCRATSTSCSRSRC